MTTTERSEIKRLDGKRAVVSGVSQGIGRAIAHLFCESGASVVGVGRSTEAMHTMEHEFHERGLDFSSVRTDVTNEEDVLKLAAYVQNRWSGLDILVNNAGVAFGRPLVSTTDEEWQRIQDVNVTGTFLMTRSLAKLMPSGGSVINVGSAGSLVALPNMPGYCASKGAVLALTRALAVDLAPEIRVNAMCPGAIDTPTSWQLYGEVEGMTGDEVASASAGNHLAKRLGQPEEVAQLAVFLASNESSFVTGTGAVVDGGFTAV